MNIAIVGGGASGVLAAIHILRQASVASITLYEPNESLGRGVAYSALAPWHVLNTPAGRVSALADCPNHFSQWLLERGWDSVTAGSTFAPRQLYGEYLESVLHQALEAAPARVTFLHQRTPIVQIDQRAKGFRIESCEGGEFHADVLILALGGWSDGSAVPSLQGIDSARVLQPLHPIDVPIDGKRVLLLGTGLTAVDALLGLYARSGSFQATAISRHGLWPREHSATPVKRFVPLVAPTSPSGVLKQIRAQIELAETEGSNWRAVLDGLRGITAELWRFWSLREQQQFLRHLRSYWDTHRHRLAPKVAVRLNEIEKSGCLRTVAGNVTRVYQQKNEVRVDVIDRGRGTVETHAADYLVPCLGNHESSQSKRLLRQMQLTGLIVPDDTALGLRALPDGRVLASTGQAHAKLFAIGPLLRGVLWECTAIPEIRDHAADLADRLFRKTRKQDEVTAL
jgi:uncharacterized NAD(P)/FAD-binding protein YdhS